jgi:hypothetical protein
MLFLNKCKRSWSLFGILATFTPFFVGEYTIYIYPYTRSRWNHERKRLFVEPHVYRLCVCVLNKETVFHDAVKWGVYPVYLQHIPLQLLLAGGKWWFTNGLTSYNVDLSARRWKWRWYPGQRCWGWRHGSKMFQEGDISTTEISYNHRGT